MNQRNLKAALNTAIPNPIGPAQKVMIDVGNRAYYINRAKEFLATDQIKDAVFALSLVLHLDKYGKALPKKLRIRKAKGEPKPISEPERKDDSGRDVTDTNY